MILSTPACGASDKRNTEYESAYSPKKFFDIIISTHEGITIFDIGGHRGESIRFFWRSTLMREFIRSSPIRTTLISVSE